MVRTYHTDDCQDLLAIHNAVFPDDPHSPSSFEQHVASMRAYGGEVWVIDDGSLAGYASVTPVPGLPGVAELDGCIAPDRQRQGLGSRLWVSMRELLKGSKICQVAYGVQNFDTPVALFLEKQGFFIEHEEWILVFDDWQNLRMINQPDRIQIQTFARKTAVPLFCDLYEKSFSGLPWDQPYSQEEVRDTLIHAHDLLFLILDGEAIGFAWAKLDSQGIGVIEPLGILPDYQNQGFGGNLLNSAMHNLRKRGARRIEIGAWRNNQRAINLYQAHGFRHEKTVTYLAFNLK